MRVAIIGSRNCQDDVKDVIIRRIPAGTSMIISGGARGVDTLAEMAAKEMHLQFRKILPDYQKYGRIAPLVRNREIVKAAELVLAFWDYRSTGTASTIAYCIENNIPVEIVGIDI